MLSLFGLVGFYSSLLLQTESSFVSAAIVSYDFLFLIASDLNERSWKGHITSFAFDIEFLWDSYQGLVDF